MKTLKTCTKCDIEREITNFYKQKCGKFGVTSICKFCEKEYKKTKIYKKSKQKSDKKFYNTNKTELNKKRRKQYLKLEIREKILKRVKKYRKLLKHKRRAKIYMRNYQIKKYGITMEQYKQILQKQNGLCAICLQPETLIDNKSNKIRRLCIDHNHKTNNVRGLLCDNCNKAIGLLKDNVDNLKRTIKYLARG